MSLRSFTNLSQTSGKRHLHSYHSQNFCRNQSPTSIPKVNNEVPGKWKTSPCALSPHSCMNKQNGLCCARKISSQNQNFQPPPKKMPFWKRLMFVSGVAGLLYYIFRDALHKKEIESEHTRYQELNKAQLGGDWTLTDHHGNKRSSTEFRGQWILLYFGFTHCPDICPEELEKLIEIVKMFDYSPKLLGFTGPEEDIRTVCKKFRVYFGKGERDENNDYIVDHTIIIYLINPRGEFVNYFGRSLTADSVYKSVAQHIARYNELEHSGKLDSGKDKKI
ncbi:hypothetical protein PoB_003469800 [Plakobranchus ocellatus]|uniref:Thioredoxin domain-containing protein n=1 Tax=Plakobranchus ocellatus TaxID=259542 RepID=A0AAV4AN21_9GAST|nr:hypothetical protein PoB_003469800 [Plakobranchus ocellatus]